MRRASDPPAGIACSEPLGQRPPRTGLGPVVAVAMAGACEQPVRPLQPRLRAFLLCLAHSPPRRPRQHLPTDPRRAPSDLPPLSPLRRGARPPGGAGRRRARPPDLRARRTRLPRALTSAASSTSSPTSTSSPPRASASTPTAASASASDATRGAARDTDPMTPHTDRARLSPSGRQG